VTDASISVAVEFPAFEGRTRRRHRRSIYFGAYFISSFHSRHNTFAAADGRRLKGPGATGGRAVSVTPGRESSFRSPVATADGLTGQAKGMRQSTPAMLSGDDLRAVGDVVSFGTVVFGTRRPPVWSRGSSVRTGPGGQSDDTFGSRSSRMSKPAIACLRCSATFANVRLFIICCRSALPALLRPTRSPL
jgi:hypothetical protein